MRNFVQRGETITATTPAGGIVSGDPILIGAMFGVAATSQAAGDPVELAVAGVFSLPKGAEAITAGAALYFDATEGEVTTTATANHLVGVATEDAGTGAATIPVRLNGFAIEPAA